MFKKFFGYLLKPAPQPLPMRVRIVLQSDIAFVRNLHDLQARLGHKEEAETFKWALVTLDYLLSNADNGARIFVQYPDGSSHYFNPRTGEESEQTPALTPAPAWMAGDSRIDG